MLDVPSVLVCSRPQYVVTFKPFQRLCLQLSLKAFPWKFTDEAARKKSAVPALWPAI